MRINKKSANKILLLVLVIAAAGLATAQILDPGASSPAGYFPPGALVYVETTNLSDVFEWWNNSDVKTRWEESDTYSRFQNSTLYLKLQDRLSDFGKDKYEVSFSNLETLAGKRSGIAVYDIGELKILAVTEVSKVDATSTRLWLAQKNFKKKLSGGIAYYVEPDEGKLAFAYVDPFLVVATDGSLIEDYIDLQSGKETASLVAGENWKQCQSMKPSGGLISIYLDQEKLNQNRYFKKYWVHRNVNSFTDLRAEWIDFSSNEKEIIERRYFVRNNSVANEIETAQPETTTLSSADWDYASLESSPDPERIARELLSFVNQFPEEYRQSSYPPVFSASAERASNAEIKNTYLQRIDEPILLSAGEKVLEANQETALTTMIADAKPVQILRLSHPLWDDIALFMQFRNVLMVRFENGGALEKEKVMDQIAQHFLILASVQNQDAAWGLVEQDTYKLHSLVPFHIRFSNQWMIASNSMEDLQRASGLLPELESRTNGTLTTINLENSRWKYSRFMRRLDHGMSSSEEPLFFSETLAGLFDTLSDLKRSTIARSKNMEVVRYELH